MKQKIGRKLLSFLLTLAMVVGLMPGMRLVAYADGEFAVRLKGVDITSQTSGEGWSYDSNTHTLTLNSYSCNFSEEVIKKTGEGDFNIILEGTNTLSTTMPPCSCISCYGGGSYTISGDGTLIINSQWDGISANGNLLTISGGNINISAVNQGMSLSYCPLKITGGKVNINSIECGIHGNSLEINAGEIQSNGGKTGLHISKGGLIISGGEVKVKDAEYTGIELASTAYMTVSGGRVETKGFYYGISCYNADNPNVLTISDGASIIALGGTRAIDAQIVKNSITGTGWNNTDGTGESGKIEISTEGQSLKDSGYKRIEFPERPSAKINTVPKEKSDLIYNGSAQELITPGDKGEGAKEIQYALGTDSSTAPKEGWSTTIPKATNAGTYYVWYKAVGDSTHTDSDPECITVTIAKKETPPTPEPEPTPPTPEPTPPTPTPGTSPDIMLNSGFQVYWKGGNVIANWGTVPSADSYEVWATYCGSTAFEKVQTVQQGVYKAGIPAISGAAPDIRRSVKAYVIAKSGGVEIGRTLIGHAAGPKNRHTNVKKLKVKKRTYNLKVGKTAKIKVTTKKMKGGKSLLPKNHDPRLRYLSTNTNVATVSGKGKIKAVGAGTCDVWVYAQNGRSQKVTVVVQ